MTRKSARLNTYNKHIWCASCRASLWSSAVYVLGFRVELNLSIAESVFYLGAVASVLDLAFLWEGDEALLPCLHA